MKKKTSNFAVKKISILVKYDLIYFKSTVIIPLIVGITTSLFLLAFSKLLSITFNNKLFVQIWLLIAMLSTIGLIFKIVLTKENEHIYRQLKSLPVNNFYIFFSNLICSYFNLLFLFGFSIFFNLLIFGLHDFIQILPVFLNNIILSFCIITIIYVLRINARWDILLKSFLIIFFGLMIFLKLFHQSFIKLYLLFVILKTNNDLILLALFTLMPLIIFLGYALFEKKFCYRKY